MKEKIKQLETQITQLQKEVEFLKSQVLFEELETYKIGQIEAEYGECYFI